LRRDELTGTQSSKTQYYYYLNGAASATRELRPVEDDYAAVLASRSAPPLDRSKPIVSADFSNYTPITDTYRRPRPAATPFGRRHRLHGRGDVAQRRDGCLGRREPVVPPGRRERPEQQFRRAGGWPDAGHSQRSGKRSQQRLDVQGLQPGRAARRHFADAARAPPPPKPDCDVAAVIFVALVVVVVTVITDGILSEEAGALVRTSSGRR